MADEFTEAQRRELLRLTQGLRAAVRASVTLEAPVEALRDLADRAEALAHALEPASTGRRPFPAYSSNTTDLPFSPITGTFNPASPEVALSVVGEAPRHVVGLVRFSRVYEGPPRHLHGGWVAAVFDQVLAFANRANGVGGMTASLTVTYRRPTPLETELRFEAWTERVEDRKVFTRGECRAGDELLSECEGVFVRLDAERAQRMFGGGGR